MVFGQPIDHAVESDNTSRRQDTGLPHAAAEHLPPMSRPLDEIPRAEDQRACRTAEAFAQAEGDRVRVLDESRRGSSERRRGIENPRSIEVHFQSGCMRGLTDCPGALHIEAIAASGIVGILDTDKRQRR